MVLGLSYALFPFVIKKIQLKVSRTCISDSKIFTMTYIVSGVERRTKINWKSSRQQTMITNPEYILVTLDLCIFAFTWFKSMEQSRGATPGCSLFMSPPRTSGWSVFLPFMPCVQQSLIKMWIKFKIKRNRIHNLGSFSFQNIFEQIVSVSPIIYNNYFSKSPVQ